MTFVFFVVPGIPGKLVITSVTQTSFFASWSPPEHPNGRITQYELRYQEVSLVTPIGFVMDWLAAYVAQCVTPKLVSRRTRVRGSVYLSNSFVPVKKCFTTKFLMESRCLRTKVTPLSFSIDHLKRDRCDHLKKNLSHRFCWKLNV